MVTPRALVFTADAKLKQHLSLFIECKDAHGAYRPWASIGFAPPPPCDITGHVFFKTLLGTDNNPSCQRPETGGVFGLRVEKNMLYI